MNTLPALLPTPTAPVLAAGRSARDWLVLPIALLLAASSPAQQVIMSTPVPPLVAPVARPAPGAAVARPSSTSFQAFPTGPSIAVGQFKLRPHLLASAVHADGLPVSGATRVTSDIYSFAPGLLADLGEYWTVDYTATSRSYSAEELRDTVDHNVRLVGANKSPDWRLQLSSGYSSTSSILIETAQQAKQKAWQNSFSVDHDFGNLLHYEGTFGMNDLETQNFSETRDWVTEQNLNAKISPRVEAGLGLGLGYSDIVDRPNTRYEEYLGNLEWRPADKIGLSLQAGWQNWHSLATQGRDERNPVLRASLQWEPFEQTRITVSDTRATQNSLTGDSVTDTEGWSISLNQRLLGKLLLNMVYGTNSSDYRPTVGSALNGRSDQVRSFTSSLSIQLFTHWSLAGTFHSSKNDSNEVDYRYTSTQYGLELRAQF